jgi:hypothetical protein
MRYVSLDTLMLGYFAGVGRSGVRLIYRRKNSDQTKFLAIPALHLEVSYWLRFHLFRIVENEFSTPLYG